MLGMQGLLVCDADGKVLYQRELPHDVIRDCVAMANELGERHRQAACAPFPPSPSLPHANPTSTHEVHLRRSAWDGMEQQLRQQPGPPAGLHHAPQR